MYTVSRVGKPLNRGIWNNRVGNSRSARRLSSVLGSGDADGEGNPHKQLTRTQRNRIVSVDTFMCKHTHTYHAFLKNLLLQGLPVEAFPTDGLHSRKPRFQSSERKNETFLLSFLDELRSVNVCSSIRSEMRFTELV